MCSSSCSTGCSSGSSRPASAWKRMAPAATSSRVPHSMNASSSSSGIRLPAVVEVLGAPGGRDAVAQLAVEPGARQRDVAQHGHHVDHERLALGAVERLAPRLVDEREQVAGRLDRPSGRGRRRRPPSWRRPMIPASEGTDSAGRAR